MSHLQEILKESIPHDHALQVTSYYYIDPLLKSGKTIKRVMDLGCGEGNSVDFFRSKIPDVQWVGLDIEQSPESVSRTRSDAEFCFFDGVHVPFNDNSFDLIFCNQAFEHVRYPEKLLKEVFRVLKPEGFFVGSASHLEPLHSYSYWNFTPFGFSVLLKDAGLQLLEVRPGIDAFSLISRRFFRGLKFLINPWKKSLLNTMIDLYGKLARKDSFWINATKLQFCGQFVFLAQVRKL
jgi:SAM-dependent methyltransferase